MGRIVELSPTNWEEASKSNILTVVYFWHEQCAWCRMLTPIFDEVAAEYNGKIKFAKLNVLESQANQEMAANLGVMSTPTLMFLCSGRPVGQVVGLMSKEDLKKTLDEMPVRYKTCIRQSTDLRNYVV